MTTTINTNKNIISNSSSIVSPSSSSSMTERSILSEGKIYSNYTNYSNYYSQELSESLQHLMNIEFWLYDSQINNSQQQQQLFSKSKLLPPPPLEIDVSSSSNEEILSPEEFDSIFQSFAADSKIAKLPTYCLILALIAAIGGLEVGITSGITNIPVDCLPMNDLLWGFAVGSAALGGLIGGISAGYFQARFGRKKTLTFNTIFWVIGGILSGASINPTMFIFGRIITGFGCGVGSVVIPISTIKLRGSLGSIYQLSVITGIVLIQLVGLPLSYVPGWRIIFVISTIPAILQLILASIIGVETPRYLISQNRIEEAKKILQKLRKGYDVDLEFEEIVQGQNKSEEKKIVQTQIKFEKEKNIENLEIEKANPQIEIEINKVFEVRKSFTVFELLKDSYCRKVMIILMVIHATQQLSGIQGIVLYSTAIFTDAFGNAAKYATISVGINILIFTILSTLLVDKIGRRPLLLSSLLGISISSTLIVIGSIYKNNILVIFAVLLFVGTFGIALGSLPFFITSGK
ncbi:11635_t:CDS:2 [Diversispora eburnea]|uniref:11635_t:CDS:1 n=1 Tax=Diversispora eburnea TaxID=1213867 RepID=A0A9N9FNZ3_9GLOM|nr:11635_t:CDS:2 [Diversispora eburnea]